MPNDPRHSRFVTVKGHTGTLVIDTHVDQPETMTNSALKQGLQFDYYVTERDLRTAQPNVRPEIIDGPFDTHAEAIMHCPADKDGREYCVEYLNQKQINDNYD